MFSPDMMDPALIAFFKQAGTHYNDLRQAEAAGKLQKAYDRYCGGSVPMTPADPNFLERCTLYAAKAFALAHIDGTVTWGGIKSALAERSVWPPPQNLAAEGQLFTAYMLGFLLGSELPRDKEAKIENMLPTAAQIAANPAGFAQSMGLTPDKLQQMASDPRVQEMMSRMGLDPNKGM